jgi:hypothetical protein
MQRERLLISEDSAIATDDKQSMDMRYDHFIRQLEQRFSDF